MAHFEENGITISGTVKVNLEQMIARKQGVVDQTVGGINYLMDKNKITVLHGVGSFVDATHIAVTQADGTSETIETKYAIIATGSKPANLPFITLDKERIITSTEALKLPEVPKHLIIIGGGVIGIELGQVYLRLGAQVSVVEFMDRIIPGMDGALSKELTKVLKKQGMKFYTSHKVQSVTRNGKAVQVQAENAKGELITLDGDYALVAVGRKPYTAGLNAENAGVKISERGQVVSGRGYRDPFRAHAHRPADERHCPRQEGNRAGSRAIARRRFAHRARREISVVLGRQQPDWRRPRGSCPQSRAARRAQPPRTTGSGWA
jgi:dihydrolipoamide dehydrogenase